MHQYFKYRMLVSDVTYEVIRHMTAVINSQKV